MLYVTMFVQLGSGFVSDWFWLFYLIPPAIGLYYLWTGIIYPWISRPDPEQDSSQVSSNQESARPKSSTARAGGEPAVSVSGKLPE